MLKLINMLAHSLSFEEVAKRLKTDIGRGLSETEAGERRERFGKNAIPEGKTVSPLKIFLGQFKSPLIYILVIAGIITLFLRDFTDTIIIFSTVLLNAAIGFSQENRTGSIFRELKKAVRVRAVVLREGNKKEIEQENLAPGDVIFISAGKKIPADGRIVFANNLKINESSLTGEWLAASKDIQPMAEKTLLADRKNMVYMGTIAEEGWAKAIVTATGAATEMGKMAEMLGETKEEKTPHQKRIITLSHSIGFTVFLCSVLIFSLGIYSGQDIVQMFLTAVAVAVAAIPEGLPVAITIILALGMERILKRKGLVRKMIAAETLGSTSIILTDKTGTLTEAKMKLAGIAAAGSGTEADKRFILKIAALCNGSFIENPADDREKWRVRGRSTEKALLMAAVDAGLDKAELDRKEPKINEIPFQADLRYSASLHKVSANENILYVLGAPEAVLGMAKYASRDGGQIELDAAERSSIYAEIEKMANRGERVLAAAYKKTDRETIDKKKDINNFVFAGSLGLKDPIRREVKDAISLCRKAGIRPIIVTGDYKLTAKAVAAELGFRVGDKNIMDGAELEKLSDKELGKRLKDIYIFARVEPRQKLRIAGAWQEKGEVVAMTGDGINDAPALKKADIGLALGSGTDVAKEASDLILLTDDFSIIASAVEEGRQIMDNIRKVITYLLSDAFTEVILIGASIAGGFPLPILPGQILWVNLIEDSLPSLALASEPKEKGLMERKPESLKSPVLTREMSILIFFIGIFTDFLLLFLFLLLMFLKLPLIKIRTMIFACLAIDSLFYVFSCRNLKKNVWNTDIFSNPSLVFAWLWGMLMLAAAIYMPFLQNLLKTVSLNFQEWLVILSIGLMNFLLIEGAKLYFSAERKKAKK